MKRILVMLLTLILLICGIFSCLSVPTSAASEFYFNGTMSKEVLRKYLSRAVTQEDLVISNCFDEDMRMLRRIGAKYIGRTTLTSWTGAITSEAKLDAHYNAAEEKLAKAHALDPEMIFQAGIFEIVFEHSVECLPIPAYVFEAFGQPVVSRNFEFDNIAFPKGTVDKNGTDTGVGCWSTAATSGVPDITQLETKMYFYYLITRYIDVGFEAIHMGQAEKMMLYRGNSYANHWDELLTKARSYAKTHARRGIVLFDYHNAIDSGGIKVGDRLIFDVQAAGLCPNETVFENNAMKCEVTAPQGSHWLSWVGRSAGGTHPLGFTVENNFTILEFDNYGNSGTPGVATHSGFMNWGFDDVTWFALQPEGYRNQFLKETDAYLKSHCLDSQGKQQYFLQPVTKRYVTVSSGSTFYPRTLYVPGKNFSQAYMDTYAKNTGSTYAYNETLGGYMFSITGQYCANRNSDACPNGFNQEDTIREIFLGENAAEDPSLQEVSLPSGYTSSTNFVKEYGIYKLASEASSSDKVLSDLFVTKQGYELDIYGGSNKAWWEIDNGQYIVLKLAVDKDATTLKLQNLNFDSAQKFKFELSPDNKTFYTIVDYPDGIDNANLETKIENQYFKNIGENATALSKASIENGKKIVYLKVSTYPTDGSTSLYSQIRIRSFDIATTRGATVSTTGTGSQFYYAMGSCQATYSGHHESNPHCFEKYVVRDKSKFNPLYYLVGLSSTNTHIVFKFDLADSATSFTPYLYAPGNTQAKIKIEASKDGNTWTQIISPITISGGYYGDITHDSNQQATPWMNLNQKAVESVLANNPNKIVYLRYSYAGDERDTQLQLQNFGISATYTYDVQTYYENGEHIPGIAATCTSPQYCTICNEQIAGTNASNHSGSAVNGGTSGAHTVWSCCGATASSSHTYTVDSGVQYSAATCTAKAKNYLKCSCGYNPKSASDVVEVGSVDASNHTGIEVNAGTSAAHTKYDCCGATIKGSSSHSYIEDSGVQYTAATCTSGKLNYMMCSCGYNPKSPSYVIEVGNKNASNHTGSEINGATAEAHTKYSCCGATIKGSSSHSYTVNSGVEATAATCTSKATNYLRCSCGYNPRNASYVVEVGSVNASKHTGSIVDGGTAAAHTKYGCCGATVSTTHSYEKSVYTSATCTTKGTSKYTCSCGYSYTNQDIAIDNNNHSGSQTNGGTADVHSKYSCCGATISTEHIYNQNSGKQYQAATCTTKRLNYMSCVCGYNPENASYVMEVGSLNAANHTGSTENGGTAEVHTKYSCCGAIISTSHAYDKTVEIAATCTTMGTSRYTCSCGYTYTKQDIAVNASNHTGDIVYVGTAGVHSKYNCCDATYSTNHTYDQNSGVKYSDATCKAPQKNYMSCICGYNPENSAYTVEIGDKNYSNHTGTVINGGTADVHTKYSCCNAVVSTAHSYEKTVETEATCTTMGTSKYTCSCGHTYTSKDIDVNSNNHSGSVVNVGTVDVHSKYNCCDAVVSTEHSYERKTITDSTCTTLGTSKYTCSCGYSYTSDDIAVKAHTVVTVPGVAATCESEGKTESKYCSVCNTVIAAQQTTPALGHDYVGVETKAPTCILTGTMTYTCRNDANHNYTVEIPATGHNEGSVVVENNIEPNCVNKGSYDNVVYCTVCNVELSRDTITVDALGHKAGDAVIENVVAPTCTNTGSHDNVVYCTVCHRELSRVTVQDEKLTHAYTAAVTAPTCEEQGYTTYTCPNCGDKYVAEYVDALGHDYNEGVITFNPTCDREGVMTFTCQNDPAHKYTEAIDKLPHSYESEEIAPDCTNKGYTLYTCSACGDSYKDNYVDALGHTEEALLAVEPTCEDDGLTAGVKCSVCEAILTEQKVIPAFGHAWDEGVITKQPSYDENGEIVYTCQNDESHKNVVVLPSLKHIEGEEVMEDMVAPTCTTDGSYALVTRCIDCGIELSRKTVIISALGHTEGSIVAENIKTPSCAAEGSYDNVKYCITCNIELSRVTVIVPMANHVSGSPVIENLVAATCSATGSYDEVIYCTVCKVELSRETVEVAKKAHKAFGSVTENRVEATCTAEGSYDEVKYCYVCGEEVSRVTKTIPVVAHTYVTATVAPTCTEQGYTTYTCKCGATLEPLYVPALGHTYEFVNQKNPTCKADGAITYACACGDVRTEVLAKLDHVAGLVDKVEAVAPTCTKEGSYVSITYCLNCMTEIGRETVVVPVADHTAGVTVVENEKQPTTTELGYYENVVYCAGCNEEISRERVSVMLGDCNGDGEFDILDLIAVKKAVLEDEESIFGSDMNQDDTLNSLDLTAMKKKLFEDF